MSRLIEVGGRFQFGDISNAHNKLPVGVYMLKFDELRNMFYLSEKESFEIPKRVYGDHSIVDRWIKSFENNSDKNMGILLSGLKGSGKTITAQLFCKKADRPVILITQPHRGEGFVDFITQPAFEGSIIFVDEFEKIYDTETQQDLLSLMDGNFKTSLIFLLTVNEFRISEYLINRLNRIKYRKHYSSLELDVVQEVIDDLLVDKSHTSSIYDFFDVVGMCTFDLLVNLIKEMNLFSECALVCGKHLNLQEQSKSYSVYELVGEDEHPCWNISGTRISTSKEIRIERRSVEYLPSKKREYEVEVLMEDGWKIDRKPGATAFILHNPNKKLKFRFAEQKYGYDMIF
jgi:hypothetical protein